MISLDVQLSPELQSMIKYRLPWWSKLKDQVQFYKGVVGNKLIGRNGKIDRTHNLVAGAYQEIYSMDNASWVQNRNARRDRFHFRNNAFITDGWFLVALYNQLIDKCIKQENAQSVLEVGSGRGQNVVIQSLKNPSVRFTGLEYSANGVKNCVELAKSPPQELLKAAGPGANPTVALNVHFQQGNAFEMPFADKNFDLSYTCLVLEQIPNDYGKVVREMARVTKGYCVFIEPFFEANNFKGMYCLKKKDYFRSSYHDFEKYGLEPIVFSTSIPQKHKYGVGVLLAKVKS